MNILSPKREFYKQTEHFITTILPETPIGVAQTLNYTDCACCRFAYTSILKRYGAFVVCHCRLF